MKQFSLYLLILLAFPLSANILTSPIDAMHQSYGADSKISKENIILTSKIAEKIEQDAKIKLDEKIIRVFKASKNDKTVGFGVLINRKVRSKNGVVLYIISTDSVLKSIEIVAFNEPMEYIPSKNWMLQFENIKTDNMLKVGKEIPTITGATMSARSIVDGSRLAFAIYNELLKEK
ncbi:MAG: FMN-binding protein [Sulfurimonas sp. RIFOXYD12_FULL_33_39]|uniref:FMN-binding protein n=1 Tax=unclassified Sulfurimonas TaxID=2623549 RepID=UPI0008D59C8E|nr:MULTISPECIES: FMN-binding protein [unclassified Sulfurimonas]OHE01080.1 MAG: FMN-binding protein [Sulfurimonas sp. RIFCSPLOWO2_12_FULL_34_6]OHE09473.1 MAG: FMN-binding protein [Sulfurimonas sp. RIFOXYD12_FULL_33_39]OHE12746.1 MAG: FMN-binding protein [Sulfurimonas sp. RIFOXYD2_FULL_34_21]DAB27437.1 MAG TPA: FMN-binding protein [Sulfurimonas sp. UBA10385]